MKLSRSLRALLFAALLLLIPASSFAGVFISVGIAPPPLPVYAQPPIPAPGYMWTPGYWAWGPAGYYWVPGTWVQPPTVGFLWTPGYWGWSGGFYLFHAGYWGPHIGFYGGINYGFGYGGLGYQGGYWNHGQFNYNTSVNNVSNVHITNVYNHTVVNNTTVNSTSFNGGTGGIQTRPTAQEQAAVNENHVQPTAAQVQHVNQAQNNPQLRASENGGKPAIAATSTAGNFKNAVPARTAGGQVNTAVYKAAAANGGRVPSGMQDPGSVRPATATMTRPTTPNYGEANRPATPSTTSTTTTRPATPSATTTRPATPNYGEANKPATQSATKTDAYRPQPSTSSNPEPKTSASEPSHPETSSHPETTPKSKPSAQSKPAPKSHSEHEEKPK